MAPKPSGGLARAVRHCARPSPATQVGTPRTWRVWSRHPGLAARLACGAIAAELNGGGILTPGAGAGTIGIEALLGSPSEGQFPAKPLMRSDSRGSITRAVIAFPLLSNAQVALTDGQA